MPSLRLSDGAGRAFSVQTCNLHLTAKRVLGCSEREYGKDDYMKICNKPCLANKDGKCAVEKCKGQIVTLRDAAKEAKV